MHQFKTKVFVRKRVTSFYATIIKRDKCVGNTYIVDYKIINQKLIQREFLSNTLKTLVLPTHFRKLNYTLKSTCQNEVGQAYFKGIPQNESLN